MEEEPNTLCLYGTSQFTVNEDHKKYRRYHDLSMFQLIFSYVQRNEEISYLFFCRISSTEKMY